MITDAVTTQNVAEIPDFLDYIFVVHILNSSQLFARQDTNLLFQQAAISRNSGAIIPIPLIIPHTINCPQIPKFLVQASASRSQVFQEAVRPFWQVAGHRYLLIYWEFSET